MVKKNEVKIQDTFCSKNERGIATLEAALLLSIFVVFMTYCVGTFGVIHSGILSSISSRAYAFETFRNRTNVIYFRDMKTSDFDHTAKYGLRAHGVVSEKSIDVNEWNAAHRKMAQGREVAQVAETPRNNNPNENDLFDSKREPGQVNSVMIKTIYGICLNYNCGDQQ